jgi:hypothetical protein
MDILVIGLGVAVLYSFLSLRILKQYERGVTFFLGRFWGTKGPGVIFLPAGFASQKRVSLRIVALDIPPQDVITRDNVSVKVNAVLYMRVGDPARAVIEIEDYVYATSPLHREAGLVCTGLDAMPRLAGVAGVDARAEVAQLQIRVASLGNADDGDQVGMQTLRVGRKWRLGVLGGLLEPQGTDLQTGDA